MEIFILNYIYYKLFIFELRKMRFKKKKINLNRNI